MQAARRHFRRLAPLDLRGTVAYASRGWLNRVPLLCISCGNGYRERHCYRDGGLQFVADLNADNTQSPKWSRAPQAAVPAYLPDHTRRGVVQVNDKFTPLTTIKIPRHDPWFAETIGALNPPNITYYPAPYVTRCAAAPTGSNATAG